MRDIETDAEFIKGDAEFIGKYRVKIKYQILAFLDEALASEHPLHYLNQLGHAVFITRQLLEGVKYVGTKAQYQTMADTLVDLWAKPINLAMLIAISETLQRFKQKSMDF